MSGIMKTSATDCPAADPHSPPSAWNPIASAQLGTNVIARYTPIFRRELQRMRPEAWISCAARAR